MTDTKQSSVETMRMLWKNQTPAANEWLQLLQRQALDEFEQTGFPSTRLENWKYTDVRKLAAAYPDWLRNQPGTSAGTQTDELDIPNCIHLTFIDGIYQPQKSTRDLPSGLLAGDLEELVSKSPEVFQDRLGKLACSSESGFVALNTAFSGAAVALVLADDEELEQPIYIEYHSSSPNISAHPRLLVELGTNSKVTIVEHFSGSCPTIRNSVTEIDCKAGANLIYYKLQEEHAESWHTAVQSIRLGQDAMARTTTVDSGAGIGRNELRVCLAGPGANLEAKGLLLADHSRHIDSRITVEHAAPDTQSRERYRSILADKARGVFNGRILVQPEAQKTAAELTNRNLLLNPGAEIDTKPELEIYADDVKCAHGSTTGQLDANSLFYLLSRGIDAAEARNILVRAFASELLTDISIPAIAERTQVALQSLRFSDT